MRALWEKNAGERQQTKQLMESERADLRAALSPENQAKFDANAANAKAKFANRGHKKGAPGTGSTAGF